MRKKIDKIYGIEFGSWIKVLWKKLSSSRAVQF